MSTLDPRALSPLFPGAPLALGQLPYDSLACEPTPASQEPSGVTGGRLMRDEEGFWRQANEALGESYRMYAQQGFGGLLGRMAIASELPEETVPAGLDLAANPTPAGEIAGEVVRRMPSMADASQPELLAVRLMPPVGSPVRVRRSNGFIEENWVLARMETRGRCLLQRGTYTKAIDLLELMTLNP